MEDAKGHRYSITTFGWQLPQLIVYFLRFEVHVVYHKLDYMDELLFTYSKDLCVRPKKAMEFINSEASNKNIYRSYIILKIFMETGTISKVID